MINDVSWTSEYFHKQTEEYILSQWPLLEAELSHCVYQLNSASLVRRTSHIFQNIFAKVWLCMVVQIFKTLNTTLFWCCVFIQMFILWSTSYYCKGMDRVDAPNTQAWFQVCVVIRMPPWFLLVDRYHSNVSMAYVSLSPWRDENCPWVRWAPSLSSNLTLWPTRRYSSNWQREQIIWFCGRCVHPRHSQI